MPLTVTRLAEHLLKAVDILRNRTDLPASLGIITVMLVLKRVSDQPGILRTPAHAHWDYIVRTAGTPQCGDEINKAMRTLEQSNPHALDGVPQNLDVPRGLEPAELKTLIDHFDQVSVSDDDLAFSDVVGIAYDRFISRFADIVGRQGGEFFTPRAVGELMVRLVRPEASQSVYDPFAGSAGMLLQARQYVSERCINGDELSLFGQEINSFIWAIGRLNLLLHSVTDSSLLCGNTLVDPRHVTADGNLMLFDRVLSDPPFSMKYDRNQVRHPERMRYGWTSEHGRADLMNIQHVLATLRPDGVGAVITPQGVLFRGGAEGHIRRSIIDDGRLEAVISLGPNVFQSTSIPVCILVLRGIDGMPDERRDQVLFINAEPAMATGRTQGRLETEITEKIVEAFRQWADIPGFSRAVSMHEIADNDFNLNVPPYVDSDLPAKIPLDVRAIVSGGVPIREVEAEATKFQAFGINPSDLFQTNDRDYFDFPPEGYEAVATVRIPELTAAREEDMSRHGQGWWDKTAPRVAEFASKKQLLRSRSLLLRSYRAELLPLKILDKYQLSGVFAGWWSAWRDDLEALDQTSFQAVIGEWSTSSGNRISHIPEDDARERVLHRLGNDLGARTQVLVSAERQKLVDTYRSWGDRYATSLIKLETQREIFEARLKSRLRELGYAE